MSKRMCLLVALVALVLSPGTHAAGVGVFEVAKDIGGAPGAGSTVMLEYVEQGGRLVNQYLITGWGSDIWGTRDQFHLAYRTMTGAVRVSACFKWVGGYYGPIPGTWSKYGVMIRASEEQGSVNYFMASRKDESLVQTSFRAATNGSCADVQVKTNTVPGATRPYRLGIQRVMLSGVIPVIEFLVDWGQGAGWERAGNLHVFPSVPDAALVGVAVGSMNGWDVAQAIATDVVYEVKAEFVGPAPALGVVPATAALATVGNTPGFKIRSLKPLFADGWGKAEMTKLLDFGCTGPVCTGPGMPVPADPMSIGERVSQFVNLHDTGGRGVFNADNGFPDESFPGIDAFQSPTADPAGGDDDNTFATEVTAVVHLTAGYHVFAARHDDGVYVSVGGVLVGSNDSWDNNAVSKFVFQVEQEGDYALNVRCFEGSGGAALELLELVFSGPSTYKAVLLGDVANGASAVVTQ